METRWSSKVNHAITWLEELAFRGLKQAGRKCDITFSVKWQCLLQVNTSLWAHTGVLPVFHSHSPPGCTFLLHFLELHQRCSIQDILCTFRTCSKNVQPLYGNRGNMQEDKLQDTSVSPHHNTWVVPVMGC